MKSCFHPVIINGLSYSCGGCLYCQNSRKNEWVIRLLHELSLWDSSCFLTLTYDEENLPANKSLKKEDLQLFMKRLRFALKGRKIKYFAAGEYGDRTFRPHYHMILYGVDVSEEEILYGKWSKGFIKVGTVTPQSVRYVAKYMLKKADERGRVAKWKYQYSGREMPFRISSNGLGKDYVLKNLEKLSEEKSILLNGVPRPLPRYYRKKLFLTVDDFPDFVKKKQRFLQQFFDEKLLTQHEKKHYIKHGLYGWLTYAHVRKRYRAYLKACESDAEARFFHSRGR